MTSLLQAGGGALIAFPLARLYFVSVRRSSALYVQGRHGRALACSAIRLGLAAALAFAAAQLGAGALGAALLAFLVARCHALRAGTAP